MVTSLFCQKASGDWWVPVRWWAWVLAWLCVMILTFSPALHAQAPLDSEANRFSQVTTETGHTQAVALEAERELSEREFALPLPAFVAVRPAGCTLPEIAGMRPQVVLSPPHRPPRSLA